MITWIDCQKCKAKDVARYIVSINNEHNHAYCLRCHNYFVAKK